MTSVFGELDTAEVMGQALSAVADFDGGTLRSLVLECLLLGGVDATVCDVVVPLLREVGARWEAGTLGVAHEHFASQVVQAALGDVHLPQADDQRPVVILACPPNELHMLPLVLFSAMLDVRGWRAVVLGASTPWGALAQATRSLSAEAVVLSAVRRTAFSGRRSSLSRLSDRVQAYVAGPASLDVSDLPGVVVLPDDWRAAADAVTLPTP